MSFRRCRLLQAAKRVPSGMLLSGGAALILESLLPAGHRPAIHLTITDDYPLAQAFVIIEALPESL